MSQHVNKVLDSEIISRVIRQEWLVDGAFWCERCFTESIQLTNKI